MSKNSTAVAHALEDYASSYTDTSRLHTPHGELVQGLAREFSDNQKYQSGFICEITSGNPAESISLSSEICLDIKELFPEPLPKLQESPYAFFVLQEWEGYVVSISEDTFTGRLVDITEGVHNEGEEADFPLDDLEDDERSRIREGAIFRWIIGYRRSPGGKKERSSRILFRNLPAWSEKELERNRRDAADWANALREE